MEDLDDGFSAAQLFHQSTSSLGLTFDDLITLPGHIDFGVDQVNIETHFTRNIKLQTPFVSSPMDTVTEADMAIAMALEGGIGIVHHGCSIQAQEEIIRRVKRFENGFIFNPQVLSPQNKISDLDDLEVSGVPITADGKPHGKLLGLVASRDVDFVEDRSLLLQDILVPIDDITVGKDPCTLEQARAIIREKKINTLPIVDSDGNLLSLVTRADMIKNRDYPHALLNSRSQRLVVGAAVGFESDDLMQARIQALVDAGVDVLILDARQGDSAEQVKWVKKLKAAYPEVDVVGGNVVTSTQLRNLLEAGIDAVRVGMGVGSVSTSQEIKAVGRAQLSAIYHTSVIAQEYGIPVIADGGIGNAGCVMKALVLGASTVMMGSLLAGTSEAPGEYFFEEGQRLKKYHGVVSHEFFNTSGMGSERPFIAHGVAGAVVDKGSIHRYVPYLSQCLRHGLQDLGVRSIVSAHEETRKGTVRFELRSLCAQREGGVHDLYTYSKHMYG